VAIAYFGTISLYNDVTKKYGYQENFPNDDEPLSMLEEVYKIIRDQDQDGEFFDPIYEDLIKEHIHEEIFQEKEDLDEHKETLNSRLYDEEEDVLLPST
jgi:hypothetical protein